MAQGRSVEDEGGATESRHLWPESVPKIHFWRLSPLFLFSFDLDLEPDFSRLLLHLNLLGHNLEFQTHTKYSLYSATSTGFLI
jgi:hypothetical protein